MVRKGVFIGLLVAVTAASAVPAAAGPGRPEVQRVLDQAVAAGGVPGMVAEVRDGQRRWFGEAGVADTATGRERRAHDRFRVGSITKTFTAIVVLQLVAEGKLSLGDTVEKWLPGLLRGNGHDGRDVTVRQLLSQTSGVFNYGMDMELQEVIIGPKFLEHRFDSVRPEWLVGVAVRNPEPFEPGTDWQYSNTNFVLAGMIVERVTGRTYADEVSRRIVRPLGLGGTYVPGEEPAIRGPHGTHYSKLLLTNPDAPIHDVTEQNASSAWAAGGVVSTVSDLNRFYGALLGGRLLPDRLLREMSTTGPTHDWIPHTRYGLGLTEVDLSCGAKVWGHGGAIHGSWTYTFGTRDGKHVVTQNVNGDWGDLIGTFNQVLEAEFC